MKMFRMVFIRWLTRVFIFLMRLVYGIIWLTKWSLSGLFSSEPTAELLEETLDFLAELDD